MYVHLLFAHLYDLDWRDRVVGIVAALLEVKLELISSPTYSSLIPNRNEPYVQLDVTSTSPHHQFQNKNSYSNTVKAL